MKKIISALLPFILAVSMVTPVYAEEKDNIELIAGYATAYDLTGKTASGEVTRDGICASSLDRMGAIIVLYQRLPDGKIGKCIGTYECLDTGGSEGIKKGTVIDVWKPTYDDCVDFMEEVWEDGCKGKVWIQVIYGEG